MDNEKKARLIAFLSDLAEVLEKHSGGLRYTTADDGVRASVGSLSDPSDPWSWRHHVSIGWPENGDTRDIRQAIKMLAGNAATDQL